jgi:K+-sensing histidine kinase KdpD
VAALTSLKDFGADIGPEAAEALESAMNDLSDLSVVRRDVDSGGLGVPAAIDRYTRTVAGLDTFTDGSIRRSQGIGLGLHIVDELARINGGTVRYEGSERGAVFVVEVPAAPGFLAVA